MHIQTKYISMCVKMLFYVDASQCSDKLLHLPLTLPISLKRAKELASGKGASSWLTALPIIDHAFCLHKGGGGSEGHSGGILMYINDGIPFSIVAYKGG